MAKSKSDSPEPSAKRRPARTPEERENQMIVLAMDSVEQRIRDGTASSAELCHFLKLASEKERHEAELKKLELETKLVEAKTKSIENAQHTDEMFAAAIEAMQRYSGNASANDEEEEDWDEY